ncbi:MAG TPA: NYN domain-containing protein [Candidatus Limnocylindria bacterium]|nr:NYN domain-containing protein [Candidatus Limnocylindria bacterium]
MPRIVVFIDAQNLYQDARRTFFTPADDRTRGQISPRRFGEVLVPVRPGADRKLHQVRIYTGRPSSSRDPQTYGAHMRQCAAWSSQPGVVVVPRSLRYPRNWPTERAQEKGIDVHLAVDLVRGYVADEFDVGIVASTDTDLVPAIEALFDLDKRRGFDPVEVCAWKSKSESKQIRLIGRELWCTDLLAHHYNRAADPTDYNVRRPLPKR